MSRRSEPLEPLVHLPMGGRERHPGGAQAGVRSEAQMWRRVLKDLETIGLTRGLCHMINMYWCHQGLDTAVANAMERRLDAHMARDGEDKKYLAPPGNAGPRIIVVRQFIDAAAAEENAR